MHPDSGEVQRADHRHVQDAADPRERTSRGRGADIRRISSTRQDTLCELAELLLW